MENPSSTPPPTPTPTPTPPAPPSLAPSSTPPTSTPVVPVIPAPKALPPPKVPNYTGIPSFSLPKKLPSKNWFIFAAFVTIPTYLWYDDRQKAKALKQRYLDRVAHLSTLPIEGGALGRVRTAAVYASRWPGEEDGKAAAWWKRYVKPYLVAAAIDYSLPILPNYSSLTDVVAKQYHDLRRSSVSAPPPRAIHTLLTPDEKRAQDLEGGIILVGRQSLKEYMEGLRQGWKEDPQDESKWINQLDPSIFEDPAIKDLTAPPPPAPTQEELVASEPKVNLFPLTHLPASKMAQFTSPPSSPPPSSSSSPSDEPLPGPVPLPPTPSTLPAHPPILLIPYHPNLGFTSIPRSIYQWFNTTAQVKLGGEAALAFILSQPSSEHDLTEAPTSSFKPTTEVRLEGENRRQGGGLVDWDVEKGEAKVPKNFEKVPEQVEERMKAYYKALEGRVKKAWEIRGGRPYTDAELKHTPPTLDELKEERIKRERRARKDLEGYRILRKGSGVAWEEGLEGRFGVWKWDEQGDSLGGAEDGKVRSEFV